MGCQTPKEWLTLQAAQDGKEAESISRPPWVESGPADASMKEVVFWSLLLCVSHHGRVKELDKWARGVIVEESCFDTSWKPAPDRWPKDSEFKVSTIYIRRRCDRNVIGLCGPASRFLSQQLVSNGRSHMNF